jgi:hypothetical protein
VRSGRPYISAPLCERRYRVNPECISPSLNTRKSFFWLPFFSLFVDAVYAVALSS